MPTKRPIFAENEIYHLTVRGIEKRNIFIEESDYWRGIFSLYEFNTTSPVKIRDKRREKKNPTPATHTEQFCVISRGREELLEVLAFVFMPNHIHLLVRQLRHNGISDFMRKFGAGYAAYFNKKYERSGHLFQGRFRASHIDGDEYLKNAFVYIHTNPISIIDNEWKAKGTQNPKSAKNFLEGYKWSSYPDYLNKKNFPSVTSRDFILKVFGSPELMKKFVDSWIGYKK